MWKCVALCAVVGLVLLATPLLVTAGGNGALKVDLQVGEVYYLPNGAARVRAIGPSIGQVVFSPTSSGKMNVTVQIKEVEPETTFECYVVPPDPGRPMGTVRGSR